MQAKVETLKYKAHTLLHQLDDINQYIGDEYALCKQARRDLSQLGLRNTACLATRSGNACCSPMVLLTASYLTNLVIIVVLSLLLKRKLSLQS